MKHHFIITSALMALFMMASCSEEDMPQGQVSGDFVTFKVAVPQISTRAISDGYTANRLYWGVYDHEGLLLPEISNTDKDLKKDMVFSGSGEVKLTLAQDKDYSIVFWAANESNSMCHVDWDGRCMSVEPKEANQESYDAFCAYVKIDNVSGYKTQEVKLYRPFAQLNIGTADYAKAAASGLTVKNTKIKVSGIPVQYNFVDSTTVGDRTMYYDYPKTPVSFKDAFPVNGYEYLAMNYILVEKDKELVTVKLSYLDDDAQEHERTYTAVPVQRNWRTNIYGNILTSETDFTVEILPGFGEDGEEDLANVVSVSTAEQLLKALASAEKETVKIVMLNDITLDGGTSAYSTEAKEVIIEGSQTSATRNSNNGKKPTLTFKDSYRTYIKLANPEGKITFNNVNINRESTGGTHWHDNNMKFCSNAEFNNVAFNKGICLDDAKTFVLNNCSINKGKVATYGMFITAGCNVTIDGLSITHSDGVAGRGIKIVDEDVDNKEALTTLSVSNATFVTEAKAAILVGSQGGANITLENINLAGVKEDGFNAVWVDEDYKAYADKVTVDGGFHIVEGTAADSNPFLEAGATVEVAKGVYSTLPKVADGVTIIAEEGTVFNGTSGISGENVTIKNVIFKGDEKALTGSLKGTTFENCQFDATYGAQWCYAYGDVTFKNCVFGSETSKRGIHFDGGDGNVAFESCTFYAFNALGQANKKYSFNNCDIKVSSQAHNKFNGVNMYGTTYEYTNCRFAPGTFTDCAGNNVVATYNNCSYTDARSIYSVVRFDKDPATCTITFDGKHYVANANALKAALANDAVTDIYLAAGKTFEGTFDITKNQKLFSDADNQATIKGRVWIN
ncbi:MAG: hypothetical protein IIW98_01300, partial [Bacteroidaceae bacterium]|nr:hypothetical protein [Bacteroidaceae bacterium]